MAPQTRGGAGQSAFVIATEREHLAVRRQRQRVHATGGNADDRMAGKGTLHKRRFLALGVVVSNTELAEAVDAQREQHAARVAWARRLETAVQYRT